MHGRHSCVCAGRRALRPASTVWRALSLTGTLLLAVAAGADVVDLAELQVQIQSPSPEVRIKAATALGETRSEAAVSILAAALAREESVSGHGVVSPKWPMLRALGTIGGDDARDALLLILDQYLQRGPSDSRYIQNDADYNLVVTSAIFVLTQWHEEPGVVERLRALVTDQSEPRKLAPWMREEAYKGCLLAEMAQTALSTPAERAAWLVTRVTDIGTGHASDWVPGMTGEKTPEAIRNAAMLRLLSEQGPEALAVVRSALVEAPDDSYERVEALARVIIMICRTQSTSAEPGNGDQ